MPLDIRLPRTLTFRAGLGTLAVTDEPVQVLPADPDRKGFLLINNGYSPCWWSDEGQVVPGTGASAHGGGLINAEGDFLSGTQLDGWLGAVWVVCDTGQSTVVFARSW